MAKVLDEFGLEKTNGDYGIEIEIEGNRLDVAPVGWVSHDDGSLRGLYPVSRNEFVSRGAVPYEKVKDHLSKLFSALEKNEAVLDFSYRTSVHVHRNVQYLNGVQLLNLIYTYLLFENALVKLCGDERENNRFCLRFQDADGMYDALYSMFARGIRHLRNYREGDIRYSSLNLASLMKFGSLEFRAMKGTSDQVLLNNWIDLIQKLYEFSTAPKRTPINIRQEFLDMRVDEFAKKVFGDKLFNVINYDNFEQDVNLAHCLTLDFPVVFERSPYIKRAAKEDFVADEVNFNEEPVEGIHRVVRPRVGARLENAEFIRNVPADVNPIDILEQM